MDTLERIYNSIEFIENNLRSEITLEEVARMAFMSPYHYHRIFQAISGVNVGSYIRLRRLTRAAESLTENSMRIIEIAVDCGYETQESFTRAFKKQFLVTPSEFRKKNLKDHFRCRKALSFASLCHLSEGVKMKPEIKIIESFTAIGLESLCTQNNGGVPSLWRTFIPRISEIKNGTGGSESYGVCQFVDFKEFTGDSEFTEFVCLPVKSDEYIPEGMVFREVKGGRFAVFTHKGSVDKLRDTYNYIYGSWLAKSGFVLEERDDMEMYDHRFDPVNPEKSEMFIYIPVK